MDPISIEMRPLFKQARDEGKWFWCHYQDLWFSPDQLESEQTNGKFRWGAVNWKLRDPAERIEEAKARRDAAQAEVDRVIDLVAADCRSR